MSELPPADGLTITKTYHFSQQEMDAFIVGIEKHGYKILNVHEFIKEYVNSVAIDDLAQMYDDHYYGSGCSLEEIMDDKHNGVLFIVTE